MKAKIIAALIVLVAIVAFSFGKARTSIVGRVNPPDAAQSIWAISSTDSAQATTTMQGEFSMDVKPGIYKIIIDAREPYKDILLENREVKADQVLDLGEIPLKQ